MAFRIQWPVYGAITNPFSSWHPAIDIGCPVGTPVQAAADGTVALITYDTLSQQPPDTWYGGYWIEIDHTDGFRTRYLHLTPFSEKVSLGQHIQRGQIIALSDTTGAATGPHVHFALWNRDAVCPGAIWTRGYYACDPARYIGEPEPPPPEPPAPPPYYPPPYYPPPVYPEYPVGSVLSPTFMSYAFMLGALVLYGMYATTTISKKKKVALISRAGFLSAQRKNPRPS